MKHPLLKNPALFIWYSTFWIILSVIQFLLETKIFEANLSITLVDVIVSNLIFALLGIGIWYVVIGGVNEKRSQLYIVLYHLFAMLFIVSFWMWLTSQIDMALFEGDSVKDHMKVVMPGKAGIGALIYILIAVFYYTFFFYNRLDEKVKEETRLKDLVTETQLNELKSQINPHYFFNSLISDYYFTIIEP